MEVILQENYPSLGYVGDRVQVKRGYARNYLLPRGIAIEAKSRSAKELKHKLAAIEAKRAKLKITAQEDGERLAAVRLEFTLKVGKGGKTFGSISVKDIERELNAKGHPVQRKQIRLGEPIRSLGDSEVQVKLHAEVEIPILVHVEGELMKDAQKEQESAGKGRKKGRKKAAASSDEAESIGEQEDLQAEEQEEAQLDAVSEEDSPQTEEVAQES